MKNLLIIVAISLSFSISISAPAQAKEKTVEMDCVQTAHGTWVCTENKEKKD